MVTDTSPPQFRLVAAGVIGLLLGGAWWLVDVGAQLDFEVTVLELVLFCAAAAVMELLPIGQPGGRAVPASVAVVGAAAVLGASPPVVALIAAAGWFIARLIDRQHVTLAELLLRLSAGWALAGIAAIGVALGPATYKGLAPIGTVAASLNVGAAVAVSLAIVLGQPFVETVTTTLIGWRYVLRRIWEAVLANGLVGTAIASTAVLGGLVHPVLGHWTMPTMLIPLLAARVGLDRFATAATAYDQTIRAMSRLPEQLGVIEHGHGVRVGQLAGDVALELGLDANLIRDVVWAAHLHELGRINLDRDDAPSRQRDWAMAGAGVIREASGLQRVADIVEAHGDLENHRGEDAHAGLPARIVAACCEMDRYAPTPHESGQRHEVVVRLVRGVGDLDVVGALTRVLDRRDALS